MGYHHGWHVSKFALNRLPKTGSAFIVNWSVGVQVVADAGISICISDPRSSRCVAVWLPIPPFRPKGGEAFLYEPCDDLNGLSYQNHLCQLESYEEKLFFEMREKHAQTVGEISGYPPLMQQYCNCVTKMSFRMKK